MRTVIAITCFAISQGIAFAEPITLKGLAPGMTKAQMEDLHPGFTTSCRSIDNSPAYSEICGSIGSSRPDRPDLATFAGVRARSYTAFMWDNLSVSIHVAIETKDFDQAEAAVTERWGKPVKRTVGTIKNRMGASFDQVEVRWEREGSLLVASKRSSAIDTTAFSLTTLRAAESSSKRRQEAAKKGASDM